MAGAMQNVKAQLANLNLIAFFEPALRLKGTRAHHAVFQTGLGQRVEQKFISAMRPLDRHTKLLRQSECLCRMIAQQPRPRDRFYCYMSLPDGRLLTEELVLRQEGGQPVQGFVVTATKTAA